MFSPRERPLVKLSVLPHAAREQAFRAYLAALGELLDAAEISGASSARASPTT